MTLGLNRCVLAWIACGACASHPDSGATPQDPIAERVAENPGTLDLPLARSCALAALEWLVGGNLFDHRERPADENWIARATRILVVCEYAGLPELASIDPRMSQVTKREAAEELARRGFDGTVHIRIQIDPDYLFEASETVPPPVFALTFRYSFANAGAQRYYLQFGRTAAGALSCKVFLAGSS